MLEAAHTPQTHNGKPLLPLDTFLEQLALKDRRVDLDCFVGSGKTPPTYHNKLQYNTDEFQLSTNAVPRRHIGPFRFGSFYPESPEQVRNYELVLQVDTAYSGERWESGIWMVLRTSNREAAREFHELAERELLAGLSPREMAIGLESEAVKRGIGYKTLISRDLLPAKRWVADADVYPELPSVPR